jgi:hypothetical protein
MPIERAPFKHSVDEPRRNWPECGLSARRRAPARHRPQRQCGSRSRR